MEISLIEREIKIQKISDEDQLRLESLPDDTVRDIVSRLPIKSVVQFTFVNKSFLNLSRDRDLARIHLSRVVKKNPCLIFHSDYPLSNQLHFVELLNQDENMEKVRRFQTPFWNSMPEFNVVGSCEGILCLANSLFSDMVCVYNPFTQQYKELPRSRRIQDKEAAMYGFGFHPITKVYKVIKIIYNTNIYNARRKVRSKVQIISLNENKWRSLGKIEHQLDRKSTVAWVNGRLHWAASIYRRHKAGVIISFDLLDELFRSVPTLDFLDQITERDFHLTVLNGCLSAVVPVRDRNGWWLDIWMMNDYNVEESWVRKFRIEDYSPRPMHPNFMKSHKIWSRVLTMSLVRVLCRLENGEILFEYHGGNLVSYNPETRRFTELIFPVMPRLFQTCVHYGSLNWIE